MHVRRTAAACAVSFAAFFLCSCGDNGGITAVTNGMSAPDVIEVHTVTESPDTDVSEPEVQSDTSEITSETVSDVPEITTAGPVTEPSDDGQLVLIKDYIPDIYLDLRYATENNFTGKVVYENADAYICYGTVKKLAAVQKMLREKGMSLIIWDPYRPVEAQEKLWEVCPDPTYVADPRNGVTSHSKGNTVDLGIVAADGSYVPVPSDFDEFSLLADRDYSDVPAEAAQNSQMLEDIMTANGFRGYWGEWWHYMDNTEYDWHF